MRLLEQKSDGEFGLTEFSDDDIPPYAILSHRWGVPTEEVSFRDIMDGTGKSKDGYIKIRFCGKQARFDGIQYFWVDTCCIDKSSSAELTEAINSMFSWYKKADRCYVFMSDVSKSMGNENDGCTLSNWKLAFRKSEWFTRGWTLQELIAPASLEFFSSEGQRLGDRTSMEQKVHEITGINVQALQGRPLSNFSIAERMSWAANRKTTRKEDKAYCLLGIFDVHIPLIYGEGDKALFRLEEEINKHSKGQLEPTGNVHWMVPRAVNTLFTGRTELLHRIQEALCGNSSSDPEMQKRFVITGLGGLGKSEVSLRAANLMREEFWGVFWVDVDTSSLAESAFINIAKTIGSSVESLHDALQVLANTKKSWLLVLDNADDPNLDYQSYLPSGTHGAVIMTSRLSECSRYKTVGSEALIGLGIQHAKELLLKAVDVHRDLWPSLDRQAEEVVNLLGSHTLALIQAGAYIAKGHSRLEQYPEVYQQQRKRLLKYKPKQGQSRYCNVYATFEASANVLERSNDEAAKDALRLLEVLSVLYSGSLPIKIFKDAWKGSRKVLSGDAIKKNDMYSLSRLHVSRLPEFISTDTNSWDTYRLIEASSLLASLSLIMQDGSFAISMHPLTHAWAKDRQLSDQQRLSWISAGCIIALSRAGSTLWRKKERQLRPHLQSCLDVNVKTALSFRPEDITIPIFLHCCWILSEMRDDSRLGYLLQDLFVELDIDPKVPSLEHLPIYDLEARSLYTLGLRFRAVQLLEQVVKIRETTLAEEHPDRLASQHALAVAYRANGQVKEAVQLLEQVVKIRETTLAEEHPDRLASQHALAVAYRANGQVKEAVQLLEQVVKISETTLAEDHPNRLASQHALAGAYKVNGQVREAIQLLEKVVKIRETTLAEEHPDRLTSQHALAGAYKANGQVKEAVQLLEQVVKIRETTLAEEHPDRLASQHERAAAYQANGQVKEAVQLLKQVVKIREATLAEDHSDRLASQRWLAYCLKQV